MIRWVLALGLLVTLIAIAVLTVEPRSDPESLFGEAFQQFDGLDGQQARGLTIAVSGPDPGALPTAVAALVATLEDDPNIARISTGPTAPDPALMDWVWAHRLHLAPAGDLSAAAMAGRLVAAQQALLTTGGAAFASYSLLDPTGSFDAILERTRSITPNLPVRSGHWQALDGSALLIFAELGKRRFDAATTNALSDRLHETAEAQGATIRLLGPRLVAAEIGARIQRDALLATGIGSGLLLIWLGWTVRSGRGLAACILPLSLGLAAATVVVQTAFGSVHVLALGFGGALTGLALDYPLHLLSHGDGLRPAARRLVLLGAGTTALVFLVLAGSGLAAFAQVGVFVASGLGVAVLAARLLISDESPPRSIPFHRLLWRMPGKPVAMLGLLVAGSLAMAMQPDAPPRLSALPPDIQADIEAFRGMLPLPSGRHQIIVTGDDPNSVVARAHQLRPLLVNAVAQGWIGRFETVADLVPDLASQQGRLASLPETDVLDPLVREALAQAGMDPAFADRILAEYATARSLAPLTLNNFMAWPDLVPLTGRIEQTSTGWRERILIHDVTDGPALFAAIEASDVTGVNALDTVNEIDARITALRARVLLWLIIGAVAAGAMLIFLCGQPRVGAGVLLQVGGALCATILMLLAITGTPSVFQLMALTLVAGIGLDYGLFLSFAEDDTARRAAARSAGLCAVSTLLVFGAMAAAPSAVLSEIGLTVSLGVLAILVVVFAHSQQDGSTH